MTPQTFQGEAMIRSVGDALLSILLLTLMAMPYLISVFANIGRRAWPTYRKRELPVRPRALLAATRKTAA
jgi:hypothetical protein